MASMQTGAVVVPITDLALASARLARQHRLLTAHSIIYASAQSRGAIVWTQDEDFRDLPGVRHSPEIKVQGETQISRPTCWSRTRALGTGSAILHQVKRKRAHLSFQDIVATTLEGPLRDWIIVEEPSPLYSSPLYSALVETHEAPRPNDD